MSDGNRTYRKKHFITYIIFLVLLATTYFFIPLEYFNLIFWVLLILFGIAEIYFLLTTRKKKNEHVVDDYSGKARIARMIFLGLIVASNIFTPADYLSVILGPILILFIIIEGYLLFNSQKKNK